MATYKFELNNYTKKDGTQDTVTIIDRLSPKRIAEFGARNMKYLY